MKLSILLPTCNRLDFLRDAIASVRRQAGGEWELVVSDNVSDEDVTGYVTSLDDERISVARTDRFLPVTENWEAALRRSSGDYVVMLGDDDALLPGYVANLERLVEQFDGPDVIYTSALLLTLPGVDPAHPDGLLKPYGYAGFFAGATEPFILDPAVAREHVRAAMDFRLTYGYNAQFLAISRRLIDELAPHGPFYQSRFPDYYSTNAAFLTARRIVIDPAPRVVIGVTPKSYGFFHVNRREDEGKAMLDGPAAQTDPALDSVLLPGSNINVGWLSAADRLAREYGARYGLGVNGGRFRRLQAAHVYEGWMSHDAVSDEQLAVFEALLRPRERRLMHFAALLARALRAALPPRLRHAAEYVYRRGLRQFPDWDPAPIPGRYASVLDVFEHVGTLAGTTVVARPAAISRASITQRMPNLELLTQRAHILKGLAMRRDSKFVTRHLKGLKGIEIGASSHNRFYLDAINVDRFGGDSEYKRYERKLALHAAKVDVVAPGDDLPFDDKSQDFVFSSHVVEHFPDPIQALYEWVRVARRYVVCGVPHRDRTIDADRPVTPVEDLLTRHREGFASDEESPTHWTVWTCESFLEMCEAVGLKVVDHIDPDDKVGNGFAVVIDASTPPPSLDAR